VKRCLDVSAVKCQYSLNRFCGTMSVCFPRRTEGGRFAGDFGRDMVKCSSFGLDDVSNSNAIGKYCSCEMYTFSWCRLTSSEIVKEKS
jgi:hypothetical protein